MKVWTSLSLLLGSQVAAAPPKCPSYTDYSADPHEPYSLGKYRIPSMRPPLECRTFTNPTVERIIRNANSVITDPDWRQLFANIFPNTLDTTVAWHDSNDTEPYTFLVTGDITAQWIRDSANQVLPYIPYTDRDNDLARLVLGLINMQAEQLVGYPFGNAFQPPSRSGLTPADNGIAVDLVVDPPFDNKTVFEAKFELDSFASFFQVSTAYWRATGDFQFMYSKSWSNAMAKVLATIQRLQEPTFTNKHQFVRPLLQYSRLTYSATETQFGGGIGNPVRYTGMAKTLFRPSDDATTFPFLVPANAFLSVELSNLNYMLSTIGVYSEQAEQAKRLASEIRQGVFQYGTTLHPKYGRVFAYETDGFGSALVMDDANGPALLSLPYLGFVNASDPIYQSTRRMILSPDDNPWYFTGPYINGIGSPHTGFLKVWPMAVAMRGMTSDNKTEIKECLDQLKASTSGLGLMHESVSIYKPAEYTRSWFAWCNSLVSQFVLDAINKFPGII
ncbi:hypothetical protein GGI04_001907 [Coemansia thaxteri]|uniref:Glycoside hydrolase family 125 protein n=1 Tax=Coemansia thaxteri TaxID=2663907 RepID=A0A9W8EH56_9FUNG|nr:hypothetical protein GGI04_001907 [Coemansia thaxteri]KAJ2007345.1 hypothetical protein H4R26_000827 [Coemansia thaxteri]KAJ2471498.1 hypothetical protein GGI02_002229 [Coemansia sp. RSA 2322]KAJ2487558.1 hypothetical protein EV174_000453 [Coemansia sp. RSA 2320]